MSVGAIYNRDVISIHVDESVQHAAELMRRHHVGDLVVVEENRTRAPVGIVTDRDIVVEVVAPGIDPEEVTVRDIMSDRIIIAFETDDEYETVQQMRRAGVRRVPVINRNTSALTGILAMDDLLEHIAEQLKALADVSGIQRARESDLRE